MLLKQAPVKEAVPVVHPPLFIMSRFIQLIDCGKSDALLVFLFCLIYFKVSTNPVRNYLTY